MLGGMTDMDGNFEIRSVPIGRIGLQVKFLGYAPLMLSNLELKSGKELVVRAQIEERLTVLKEVDVVYKEDKREIINKMATVSARTLSVEEAAKFAGTFNDPARMAQNYAGVSGVGDERNDIIIRGNSPMGVLWRMDGIDIPSPNHFATLGTTGGAISMLNINNLSNSDFYTSAWTPDYGNALSGVFDLRLRNGNNSTYEFLGQVGFNGFELGAEGPFSAKSKASFLVNYRYSTLGVISALGIDLGVGAAVPQYQDVVFKMNFPTKKAGRFTVWGLGGISKIEFEPAEEESGSNLYADESEHSNFGSNTAIVGASHTYFFSKKTFYRLTLSSSWVNGLGSIDSITDTGARFNTLGYDRKQAKNSLHAKVNHKFNAKNTLAAGFIADNYITTMRDSSYSSGAYKTIADNEGSGWLLQSYVNYQHRFNEQWIFNGGLHTQHFSLAASHAVEPRLGFKFKPTDRHSFSFGSGLHSQMQPVVLYFVEREVNGEATFPNQSLGFSRSIHNALGYDIQMGSTMRLKTEIYYQHLYHIPVDTIETPFSMLNEGANFAVPRGTGYVNEGTGSNYGLEVTLERFLDRGYYFLLTTSLFDSKYKGSDGIRRNTIFNGNYIFNALAGKEFPIGSSFVLGFDWKLTYAGGRRYTPIDLEASRLAGRRIEFTDRSFESQYRDYFRTDFKVTLKHNSKKVSQSFSADLQNLTNQKNIFQQDYNASREEISTVYQRGFFPNIQYVINF